MSVWHKTLSFFGLSEGEAEVREPKLQKRRLSVVNFRASGSGTEIVVKQPASFEEVQEIADHLKLGQAVVLNLAALSADTARRVVDFASGVIYALDGHMQRVSDEIFIFTPPHVEVIAAPGGGKPSSSNLF